MTSNMNLRIPEWDNDNFISINHICEKQGGKNRSPTISWDKVDNIGSYALILEDITANNYIHWYIPYIDNDITQIDPLSKNKEMNISINNLCDFYNLYKDIKVKQGLNTYGHFGYDGPCPPNDGKVHEYVFNFYELSDDITKKNSPSCDDLKIIFMKKTTSEFEEMLNSKNIEYKKTQKVGRYQNTN